MENRMFSLFVLSLVIAVAVVALDGQILNIPTSFLTHHHHQQQQQQNVKDSYIKSKADELPPSIKHSVDDESLSKRPTIKDSNEPHKGQTVSTFCNVEISKKIPGNCITVGQLGRACVAGDYLDLFSVDCM